jgi:MFS family permease
MIFYRAKGLSISEIGLTLSIIYLFSVLFEYPSGIFADRFGRKKSIQISIILVALSVLNYGIGTNLPWLLVAAALEGVGIAFYSGADVALIYDNLKKQKQQKKNKYVIGFVDSVSYTGMLLGSLIGPFLFKTNNLLPFIISPILYLLGFFIFSSFKESKKHYYPKEIFSLKKTFKEGFKLNFSNKSILTLLVLSGILLFFYQSWFAVFQIKLFDLGLSETGLGIYVAFHSIIGLLQGLLIPHIIHKMKSTTFIFIIILTHAVGLIFLSNKSLWVVFPLSYLILNSRNLLYYSENDVIHDHIPSKIRATVISARSLIISLLLAIATIIMTKLVEIFSINIYVFFGIISFILCNFVLIFNRKHLDQN